MNHKIEKNKDNRLNNWLLNYKRGHPEAVITFFQDYIAILSDYVYLECHQLKRPRFARPSNQFLNNKWLIYLWRRIDLDDASDYANRLTICGRKYVLVDRRKL